MWLPNADSPEKIVGRAEWLLANHPPQGRYNLIGNNCEHAANFCVAEFTESLQVRRFFLLRAAIGSVGLLYVAWRVRTSQPIPWRPVIAIEATSLLTVGLYHYHIRRFWRDIGQRWQEQKQARHDGGPQDR